VQVSDPTSVVGTSCGNAAAYPAFDSAAKHFYDCTLAEWATSPGDHIYAGVPIRRCHADLVRRMLPIDPPATLPSHRAAFCSRLETFKESHPHFQPLPYILSERATPSQAVFCVVWVHKSLIMDMSATLASLSLPVVADKYVHGLVQPVTMEFGEGGIENTMMFYGRPWELCPSVASTYESPTGPLALSEAQVASYDAAWQAFCDRVTGSASETEEKWTCALFRAAVFGFMKTTELFRGAWRPYFCAVPVELGPNLLPVGLPWSSDAGAGPLGKFGYILVPKLDIVTLGVEDVLTQAQLTRKFTVHDA
jgi:hypothetical protein